MSNFSSPMSKRRRTEFGDPTPDADVGNGAEDASDDLAPPSAVATRPQLPVIDVASAPLAADQDARYRAAAAMVRKMAAPQNRLFYIPEGLKVFASNIGPNPEMRPLDVTRLEVGVASMPVFEPQVFPSTVVGTAQFLDLDEALVAAGLVAAGVPIPLVGVYIRFVSTVLTTQLGQEFSIGLGQGPGVPVQTLSATIERATQWVGIAMFSGAMQGGLPRLTVPTPVAALPGTGQYRLTTTLEPALYRMQVRFMQLGDATVERYLASED